MSEEKQESKGLNLKMIAIIGVAIVLVAGGVSFGIAKMLLTSTPTLDANGNEVKPVSPEMGISMPLGDFTTNINSTGGLRFVQASMVAELNNKKVGDEITDKKPMVDDAVIAILRSKDFEALKDPNATEALKTEIITKINSFLVKGKIENIYFTKFVTQ